MPPELLLDARHALAEGPVWHQQRLWWVNIPTGSLHAIEPASGEVSAWTTGERTLGAALPTERGDWILAGAAGLYRWALHPGTRRLWVKPEDMPATNRFNDAKVDPSGRLWAGTMDRDGAPGQGALYSIAPGASSLSTRLAPVDLSNGLAWDAAAERFCFIDTPTRTVQVFPWDSASGDLGPREAVIDLGAEAGFPDGMCIDEAGHLWIAMWGGAQVLEVSPREGRVCRRLPVPAPQVTSCCFGGARRDTLFITTARVGLGEGELAEHPLAGGIFFAAPGVAGPAPTLFPG